jgi:hypothetical protein
MLDKLLDLIRGNAGEAVTNNPAIPNEKNEEAVQSAGSSIMATLQNALAGGKIKDVLGYFTGKSDSGSDLVKEATTNYSNDLQTKMGLGADAANDVANKVVPASMTQLANKTADPSDNGFNIQDIFNKLSGGKTGGLNIQEMINKYTGGKLDIDKDGDVDLQDLKGMFAGGAGGLMDKVKSLW